MFKAFLAGAVGVLSLAFFMGGSDAGEKGKDKDKLTIKQVMQKAMKGGLCGKVASGKASEEEQKELVALFTAMAANTPPKGDADSWKEKCEALIKGAKEGGAALKKAADCAGCHGAHKGKKS
jgi:surface antigen